MSSVDSPFENMKGEVRGVEVSITTIVHFFSVHGRRLELQERRSLLEPGLRDNMRKWGPKHQEREQFLFVKDSNLLEGDGLNG